MVLPLAGRRTVTMESVELGTRFGSLSGSAAGSMPGISAVLACCATTADVSTVTSHISSVSSASGGSVSMSVVSLLLQQLQSWCPLFIEQMEVLLYRLLTLQSPQQLT